MTGWCFVFQELLQLEDRLGSVSRGAVQNTIERFTFPHKYKKVRAGPPASPGSSSSSPDSPCLRKRVQQLETWGHPCQIGQCAGDRVDWSPELQVQTSPDFGRNLTSRGHLSFG